MTYPLHFSIPYLFHGYKTLAIREHDKSSISMEMKFKRRKAKYTWQDYKKSKDILL
jgi:hypothetical protein